MADRASRAAIILQQKRHEFKEVTRRLTLVPSQHTAGKRYRVAMQGGRAVRGSCPDYRYRQPVGGCKHMIAATKYHHLRF